MVVVALATIVPRAAKPRTRRRRAHRRSTFAEPSTGGGQTLGVLDKVVPEAARRFGDHPALLAADGTPVSYVDLDRRSDEVAVGLSRRGIGLGAVVALTLPSTPEYVVAYAALAKVGAVTAGVNPRLTDAERATALEVVGPDLVLDDAAAVERASGGG